MADKNKAQQGKDDQALPVKQSAGLEYEKSLERGYIGGPVDEHDYTLQAVTSQKYGGPLKQPLKDES